MSELAERMLQLRSSPTAAVTDKVNRLKKRRKKKSVF